RIKVSNDSIKTINPGNKKVYRFYDKDTGYALGDVITLNEEEISKDHYTLVHPVETWKKTELKNYNVRSLLVPIFKNGELVYQDPSLQEKQEYCEKEFETLYPEVTRIEDRKSTRLNSSHVSISYAVFCLKKKKKIRR